MKIMIKQLKNLSQISSGLEAAQKELAAAIENSGNAAAQIEAK